ncbi:MAG: type II toxin-antitoxin system VapC family toxin [Actinobacteria bacterium]|nr:type II toxin-antitoxin system VapC family toxin [Actinomycetota bacterium]
MLTYLDTSAALKLVVDEPESEALVEAITADPPRQLVSSWLLHTEMFCAAGRHPDDIDLDSVRAVLEAVSLADLARGDLIAAGTHTPLRSNDAVHLAVAIRLGVDEVVTYDPELSEAVTRSGLAVVSPG